MSRSPNWGTLCEYGAVVQPPQPTLKEGEMKSNNPGPALINGAFGVFVFFSGLLAVGFLVISALIVLVP